MSGTLAGLENGGAPPWRVAYCFDRLGLVAQLLGWHDLAEDWYLLSLALMDLAGWRPTPWNALTCRNLARSTKPGEDAAWPRASSPARKR